MADPAKKAAYEQASRDSSKPLFSLTIADFFNAPVVDEVDLSAYGGAAGDTIVVLAHDDIEVTRMSVSVNNDNAQIESGQAVETPAKSGRWVYTATAAVPQGTNVRIAVTVSDQPGGSGEAAAEKSL